jgi:hypothetical protein
MTATDFDNRLRELSAMVASPATDLFNAEYERLLIDIKADDADERYDRAARMRTVLMHQAAFLVTEWFNAKRDGAEIPAGGAGAG